MFKKILTVLFILILMPASYPQPVNLNSFGKYEALSFETNNDQKSESGSYDSLQRRTNKVHIKLAYQAGIGSYAMGPLKNINDQVLKSMPFDAKIVDNFPNYFYSRPSITLESGKYSIGLICTFQSTGSRVSSKDFSGEYLFDTKVYSTSPGIYGEVDVFSLKRNRISLYLLTGLVFSKLNMHESLKLQSKSVINGTFDFKGQNYFLEPGLCYYYFFGSFGLGLNAGYFFTLGNQAFYSGNKKNVLQDNIHYEIKPDWNGIRAGISIVYRSGK